MLEGCVMSKTINDFIYECHDTLLDIHKLLLDMEKTDPSELQELLDTGFLAIIQKHSDGSVTLRQFED